MQVRFSLSKKMILLNTLISLVTELWISRKEIFRSLQRWALVILVGGIVIMPIGMVFIWSICAGFYCIFWRVGELSFSGGGLIRMLVQILLGIAIMLITGKLLMSYIEKVGDRISPLISWLFRTQGSKEIIIKRNFLRRYFDYIRPDTWDNEPAIIRMILVVGILFVLGMCFGAQIII